MYVSDFGYASPVLPKKKLLKEKNQIQKVMLDVNSECGAIFLVKDFIFGEIFYSHLRIFFGYLKKSIFAVE